MALEQELNRVHQAREQLGVHLDEVERRFSPGYVGGIVKSLASHSMTRHPVAWAVGTSVLVAATVALVAWALLSDDD